MEIKLRAWNRIVCRMQYFTLQDIEKQKGTIQWQNLDIMIFTGLQDKNNVDIYEGDILDFDEKEWGSKGFKSEVKWNNDSASWDFGGGIASDVSIYRSVIGNIYQDAKLLKNE